MLGCVLPQRNSEWLNAGPRTWIAFCADNGDIKFPHRLPVLPETHEQTLLFDLRRSSTCNMSDNTDMIYDLQAGLAMAAGYFGGYTSKMQDVGQKELARMRESLSRKLSVEPRYLEVKEFQMYSKRLVKDLEAKGIIRTAVESLNLQLKGHCEDVTMAECIRTFPTVTFPATLLLKREEVETLKVTGASIIAALHHTKAAAPRAYVDAPFDLLYGFRGNAYCVDLLSPYEMLTHWSMEKIKTPSLNRPQDEENAEITEEGRLYKKECRINCCKPEYVVGVHYVVIAKECRICIPELVALRSLRHRWCWQRRPVPQLPCWSFSKVPRSSFSPEENARLLSVYMRPWTLYTEHVTESNPLLSELGLCYLINGQESAGVASASIGSTSDECRARAVNVPEEALEMSGPVIKRRRTVGGLNTRCPYTLLCV
jgi:hypothetical protein